MAVVYFNQRLGAAHNSHFQCFLFKKATKSCDLQLFIGENVFLEKKAIFLGIKQSTSALVQTLKKRGFYKNLLQISCFFFSFFAEKTLKMTISTSIWGAQHLNAGLNIQHLATTCFTELQASRAPDNL